MGVILLFDQYLLAKQQNDIHFINNTYWPNSKMTSISYDYITEYMTKWKHFLAWYDVAINSTIHTCILLDKFKLLLVYQTGRPNW